MDMLYFPGCTIKTSAKVLESSAFAVAEALGHTFVEMEEWNCCGVVASLTEDDLMHHLAPLRNLIRVEDQKQEQLFVLCDMCGNTLKQTNLRLDDRPADLETLNSFMDLENDYNRSVQVVHFLEFLRDQVGFDQLKKRVERPLKGLRIMPYYGCTLLRPREVAIDDSEDPKIMADLLSVLGAEVVDSRYKIECCGSYHTIDLKENVVQKSFRISASAQDRQAEAIMLSCPMCKFNLDFRGKEATNVNLGHKALPVYYYTQLMALALGLDISVCGFDSHAVDPVPLLKKKGII